MRILPRLLPALNHVAICGLALIAGCSSPSDRPDAPPPKDRDLVDTTLDLPDATTSRDDAGEDILGDTTNDANDSMNMDTDEAALDTAPDAALDTAPDAALDTASDAVSDTAPVLDTPSPRDVPTVRDPSIAAPRLRSPLSTTTVTSQRPTLRWVLPDGVREAVVDVCRDRACATIEQTFLAVGTSGRPPIALAHGAHFWRVRGVVDDRVGVSSSAVWEFFARRRSAEVDASWGCILDPNGDGVPDITVDGLIHYGPLTMETGFHPVALTIGGSCIGDVNGDGFSDLYSMGSVSLGSSSGLRPGVPWGFEVPTITSTERFWGGDDEIFASTAMGSTTGGDINGDGYGDVLSNWQGQVLILYGGATGIVGYSRPSIPADGVVGGMDFNEDGFSDIVAVVPTPMRESSIAGEMWGTITVHLGSASGVSATPSMTISGSPALGRAFGHTTILAGDLNGDGRPDLAMSARTVARGVDYKVSRFVHVFYGVPMGIASTPGISLTGSSNDFNYGLVMAPAGDMNGDGFDDLVVRAPQRGSDNGEAQIHFGAAAGLSVEFESISRLCENGFYGFSMAGAGDVTGDGFDDVIAGQPGPCRGGSFHIITTHPMSSSFRFYSPDEPTGTVFTRNNFGRYVGGRR
jgi:hypothetical protein